MMKRLIAPLAGALVIAGALAGPAGTSNAATSSPSTAHQGIATKSLPANWESLSVDQLAAYGIKPGEPGDRPITVRYASTGLKQPRNHSGCNGNVCIDVLGGGLTTTSWGTHATLASGQHSYAIYIKNGSPIYTSSTVWYGPGTTGEDEYPTEPQTYPNNTNLCNEWPGVSGEPCANIHS